MSVEYWELSGTGALELAVPGKNVNTMVVSQPPLRAGGTLSVSQHV